MSLAISFLSAGRFYSNVDPNVVYGDFSQSLPNSVFTVALEDDAQKIVEVVTYSGQRLKKRFITHICVCYACVHAVPNSSRAVSDRAPWSPLASGFGSSLERLCLTSDASKAGNWIASPVPADADKHVEVIKVFFSIFFFFVLFLLMC